MSAPTLADAPETLVGARARLIEAAARVLAERGYEAATVKEIARAAGVNQGLVHYYFGSKDALLLAVVREASDRYAEEMRGLRAGTPGQRLGRAALGRVRERIAREPEQYRLHHELFGLALTRPGLRSGVAALLAAGRGGIGQSVLQAARRPVTDAEADALAAVLIACFDGLALQVRVDPDFDLDAAFGMLARLLSPLLDEP